MSRPGRQGPARKVEAEPSPAPRAREPYDVAGAPHVRGRAGLTLVQRRSRREAAAATALLAALLAFAWIGRAAVSSDGAQVLSETLGFLITGRLEAAQPGADGALALHSKYGPFPCLLALPFVAPAWELRDSLGSRGVEAAVSILWAAGAAFAAVGFLAVVRALRPGASPLWAPAFLAGTFLWPYAADSFFEPWAAAAAALSAASLLSSGEAFPRRGASAAALLGLACLLKPAIWILVPVYLLAAAMKSREGAFLGAFVLSLGVSGLAAAGANLARTGSALDVGYGTEASAFSTPLGVGLAGLLVSPGRGVVLFAPVVLVSAVASRRLSPRARLLCLGAPSVLLFLMARWWCWHGASAWGPRMLLPALPLLAAPAAAAQTVTRRWAAATLVLGCLVNVPGVLVAPGAWISYAESLRGAGTEGWPAAGADRVSRVPSLSMLYGGWWLLSSVGDPAPRLGRPWPGSAAPPGPVQFVSPAWLRYTLGLPPPPPVLPAILGRTAAAYRAGGREREASLFLAEAERLARGDAHARRPGP